MFIVWTLFSGCLVIFISCVSFAQSTRHISREMQEWIENTCGYRNNKGSPLYQDCLANNIKYILKNGEDIKWRGIDDTSKSNIKNVCENSKLLGPQVYFQCVNREIDNVAVGSKSELSPNDNLYSEKFWRNIQIVSFPTLSVKYEPTILFEKLRKSVHLVLAGNGSSDNCSDAEVIGSGVAITSRVILTNAHVVESKRFICVKVDNAFVKGEVVLSIKSQIDVPLKLMLH